MSVDPEKGRRSKIFDLLSNPFSILRIGPTADLSKITDAFDDAVADGIASEADLTATREVIINPRLRTSAEISFLVDTPAREADAILNALRSKSSLNDLLRVADRLAPLSKANLLAHVAAHQPASADLLFALVDAQAQISPEIVHSKLESVRRAAGIVVPSLDIRAAFEAVTGGVWSSDLRACPGGAGNTDALPLTITAKRAETEGARCEFGGVSGQGQNWKTTGTCTANGQTWVANISLMRVGDTLTWTSERGTAKYLRCNN